jgi:ParB family chromosome partitioning protein
MNGSLGRGLGSLIPGVTPRSPGVNESSEHILQLPTGQIVTNPRQPRKTIDHAALEDLINSIREHGIVQPLVVTKTVSGYQLIAGERRWRAAQIVGLKTVPAVVRDATKQQQLELAIVENVQRKDLNPMERAYAYQKLIDEFGLTQEQVAKRVGKSRVTVANTVRLLDLPTEVQQAVADGRITEGHAKVIASAPDAKAQRQLLADILDHNLTVRGGATLAKGVARVKRTKPANPDFVAAEDELRNAFGTRVRVDRHGKVGTITIEFYSAEEFRALLERLRRS